MSNEEIQLAKGQAVKDALEVRNELTPTPFEKLPPNFQKIVNDELPDTEDEEIITLQKEEKKLWKKLLLQIAKVFSLQ